MSPAIDLAPLGQEVRRLRALRGLTLKTLAEKSGLSERFVSDLERGVGNIAVSRLWQVSAALEVSLAELVAVLDRAPRAIALVGLRGAGKSTIGRALAGELGWPLVELDREVERRAGLSLAEIFELHGEAHFRRLERACLDEVLGRGAQVLATGGGIVNEPESWALLKRRADTVWLSAPPEAHYRRVFAQGDRRPMKNRPEAMQELSAILAERAPRYAEAGLTVETAALGERGAVSAILRWVSEKN